MAGAASLEARFIHRFPNAENRHLFRAPGRVNLIGEHTDYNQGLVLPMAISLACYAVTGTASDNRLRVYSESQKDGREWTMEDVRNARPAHDWTDYFVGVAQQLMASGIEVRPGSVLLYSTVPLGGGLSSSAAIERVEAFAQASEAGNCEAMGKLLLESHASLRNDYEVSCEELDFLVEHAMRIDGVYGARMIGGGFGGCTLNMIRPDALDDFESEIRRLYEERFGIRPEIYPCSPSAGALETVERE